MHIFTQTLVFVSTCEYVQNFLKYVMNAMIEVTSMTERKSLMKINMLNNDKTQQEFQL